MLAKRLLPILIISSSSAFAQQQLSPLPSFSLERFSLDPSAVGSLALGAGATMPQGGLRVALGLHYERNPLVLFHNGVRTTEVIGDRWTTNTTAAFAPTSWLELGGHLDFVPRQTGGDLGSMGYAQPRRMAATAPFVSARTALLRSLDGAPFDLAVQLGAALPFATGGSLGKDDGLALTPRVMVSKQLGPVLASADAGTLLRRAVDLPGGQRIGSQLDGGAAASFQLAEQTTAEISARGALAFTRLPASVEVLAGLRVQALPFLEVFGLAGPGIDNGPGTPAFRAIVGVAFNPFTARRARAPLPRLAIAPLAETRVFESAAAIAEPVKSSSLLVIATPPELPEPPPPMLIAAVVHEIQPRQLVVLTREKIEIKDVVYFDTGKASIQGRSFPLLDQVAALIVAHPELPLIRIEGHTDDKGSPQANRKLSQGRAEAVREYLAGNGVAEERLQASGLGPDKPIAPNKTPSGRAKNRRVEFALVTQAEVSR